MAVIRVEKRKGYTIMSNYHLRDKNLSLKAKGLLSIMLSLPDEWHYNVRGLAAICKEGVTSISSTLKELEQWGYMRRHQPNTGGKFGEIEYIIYETPQKELAGGGDSKSPKNNTDGNYDGSERLQDGKSGPDGDPSNEPASEGFHALHGSADALSAMADKQSGNSGRLLPPDSSTSPAGQEPCARPPYTDLSYTGSPCTENPYTVNPDTGYPYAETSCTQNPDSNKRKSPGKTDRKSMDQNNYPSINQVADADLQEMPGSRPVYQDTIEDAIDMDDQRFLQKIGAQKLSNEFDAYRELVKENIEFDYLIQRYEMDTDTIRGIVDIMVEAICSSAPVIRIGGQEVPQGVVKSRLLKLRSDHIEYVMTCLSENTTKIRNIKSYLLTTLYNAPSTIDAFYQNWVQSDNPALARRL